MSPLYWAGITYLLVHALGSAKGTAVVKKLHDFVNELADEPALSA